MRFYYLGIALLLFMTQIVHASHQIEVRHPSSVTTTVGELTLIQIDIKNNEPSAESYRITIGASSPNEMQITNPLIITPSLDVGQIYSAFSNIVSLTETPNVLTVEIFGDTDSSPTRSIAIPVQSKKYSLPEFGLMGFLQIAAIAAVVYFFDRPSNRREKLIR